MRSKLLSPLFFSILSLASSFVCFELRSQDTRTNWQSMNVPGSLSAIFGPNPIPLTVEVLQIATLNPFQPNSLRLAYRRAADYFVRVRQEGGSFQAAISALALIQNQLNALEAAGIKPAQLWPVEKSIKEWARVDGLDFETFLLRLRDLGVQVPYSLDESGALSYLDYVLFNGPLDPRVVGSHLPWLRIFVGCFRHAIEEYFKLTDVRARFSMIIPEALRNIPSPEALHRGDVNTVVRYLAELRDVRSSYAKPLLETIAVPSFREEVQPQLTKLENPWILATNLVALSYIPLLERLLERSENPLVRKMVEATKDSRRQILVSVQVEGENVKVELKLKDPQASAAVTASPTEPVATDGSIGPITLSAHLSSLVLNLKAQLNVTENVSTQERVQGEPLDQEIEDFNKTFVRLASEWIRSIGRGLPNQEALGIHDGLATILRNYLELLGGSDAQTGSDAARPRIRPFSQYIVNDEEDIDHGISRSIAALVCIMAFEFLAQGTPFQLEGASEFVATAFGGSVLAGSLIQAFCWFTNDGKTKYTGRIAATVVVALVMMIDVVSRLMGETPIDWKSFAPYAFVIPMHIGAELPRLANFSLLLGSKLLLFLKYRRDSFRARHELRRLRQVLRSPKAPHKILFQQLQEILNLSDKAASAVELMANLKAWRVLNQIGHASGRAFEAGEALPSGCLGHLVVLGSSAPDKVKI